MLIRPHQTRIVKFMHMTLNIDAELLREASRISGIREKSALVRAGLQALISKEVASQLAKLGGNEPLLRPVRRRRPAKAVKTENQTTAPRGRS